MQREFHGLDSMSYLGARECGPAEDTRCPDEASATHDVRALPPASTDLRLNRQQLQDLWRAAPGGSGNVCDFYPLSPLQAGMLFHRLLDENNDSYVQSVLFELQSGEQVPLLIRAVERVIRRHDALRSAMIWEKLPQPVQVVLKEAALPVHQLALDASRDALEQLREHMKPGRHRLDVRSAPIMLLQLAQDPTATRCFAILHVHHMVCDHQSLRTLVTEVLTYIESPEHVPEPVTPYKEHVANALAAGDIGDAEAFFREELADVDAGTAPLEPGGPGGHGAQVCEYRVPVEPALAQLVRQQARSCGVSTARLFHAAWAVVVARTSGRDDIVFGTVVLTGRRRGADARPTFGLTVNTLPLRLRMSGISAMQLVESADTELHALLRYEQTSLATAQRCSGIRGSAPLFTSILNYRHSLPEADKVHAGGISVLRTVDAWTHFALAMTVDNLGAGFSLTAQTDSRIDPRRVTDYLQEALRSLTDALAHAPHTAALGLSILPASERRSLLEGFRGTRVPQQDTTIHELFEMQAKRTPAAVAVVHGERSLTYTQINGRANQLARYLRAKNVQAGELVGIAVGRSAEMVVGLLGILKAGATYVPLDPNLPAERLAYMVADAAPRLVLMQERMRSLIPAGTPVVTMESEWPAVLSHEQDDLPHERVAACAEDLVYVIYTSGSTGRPKGTAMSHRAMCNLIAWHQHEFGGTPGTRVLQFAALSFDVAFQETFSTLCTGDTLVLVDEGIRRDALAMLELLRDTRVERLFVPPLMLQSLAESSRNTGTVPGALRDVITAGEQLRISGAIVAFLSRLPGCRLHNHYGPTETHVVTAMTLCGDPRGWPALPSIGRPIANAHIYILDAQREPVPIGVAGEIYIGGAGVARGYWNRPELTAERFLSDPLSAAVAGRMYRSGDVGRWRAEGTIEYLGRNDDQVKIRGYRIELGEIEAQLSVHAKEKRGRKGGHSSIRRHSSNRRPISPQTRKKYHRHFTASRN